jgi:hypothetical protein
LGYEPAGPPDGDARTESRRLISVGLGGTRAAGAIHCGALGLPPLWTDADFEQVERINALYKDAWGPLHNFFLPSMKLIKKWRVGSRWVQMRTWQSKRSSREGATAMRKCGSTPYGLLGGFTNHLEKVVTVLLPGLRMPDYKAASLNSLKKPGTSAILGAGQGDRGRLFADDFPGIGKGIGQWADW